MEEALETGLQQALKLVVKKDRMKSSTLGITFENSTYDVLDIHYIYSFFGKLK
jgi:hypothetical protein